MNKVCYIAVVQLLERNDQVNISWMCQYSSLNDSKQNIFYFFPQNNKNLPNSWCWPYLFKSINAQNSVECWLCGWESNLFDCKQLWPGDLGRRWDQLYTDILDSSSLLNLKYVKNRLGTWFIQFYQKYLLIKWKQTLQVLQ